MTILLKQLFNLLKLLNSETGESQIAAGLALGLTLGFSPGLSLQSFLIVFIILIFRVQIGAVFISAFFFKLINYILDPVFDTLGRYVLESSSLHGTFVELYNLPLVPLTRFNNSVVMGSGIFGLLGFFPFYFFSRFIIRKYRSSVVAKIKGTATWKALQATAFFKWYATYDQLTQG